MLSGEGEDGFDRVRGSAKGESVAVNVGIHHTAQVDMRYIQRNGAADEGCQAADLKPVPLRASARPRNSSKKCCGVNLWEKRGKGEGGRGKAMR